MFYIVELDFSPKSASIDPLRELRRSSRHVLGRQDLRGGERAARNLICSPAAEVLLPPCDSQ